VDGLTRTFPTHRHHPPTTLPEPFFVAASCNVNSIGAARNRTRSPSPADHAAANSACNDDRLRQPHQTITLSHHNPVSRSLHRQQRPSACMMDPTTPRSTNQSTAPQLDSLPLLVTPWLLPATVLLVGAPIVHAGLAGVGT
jgi:hypothetical protein